jgi:hypothetical protein
MTSPIECIFKKFHAINDIKHIITYYLVQLNQLQHQELLKEIDKKENLLFYGRERIQEIESEIIEIQVNIHDLTNRCLHDIERLIIEVQIVLDYYDLMDDKVEVDLLFNENFTPLIQAISNLDCLFASKSEIIKELLFKIRLLGKTLQRIMHFEIQMEVK